MNDRLKYRVWDNKEKRYVEEYLDREIMLSIDGTLNACAYDFSGDRSIEDINKNNQFEVEFCTGLKDKNGKLIYEGDIVEIMVWDDIEEDMVETKGKIYWSKEDAAFLIYVALDEEYSLNDYETMYGQEIKVIGNIHENKDLLEADNAD